MRADSQEDRLDLSERQNLQASFKADKSPVTESEMQRELVDLVAGRIAHFASVFNP